MPRPGLGLVYEQFTTEEKPEETRQTNQTTRKIRRNSILKSIIVWMPPEIGLFEDVGECWEAELNQNGIKIE